VPLNSILKLKSRFLGFSAERRKVLSSLVIWMSLRKVKRCTQHLLWINWSYLPQFQDPNGNLTFRITKD
jgi:hypothetical protein